MTDAQGRARVTLTGTDPGNPRKVIDGALGEVAYGPLHRKGEPDGKLSVRVFDAYRAPERPALVLGYTALPRSGLTEAVRVLGTAYAEVAGRRAPAPARIA
ncbi:hypothetical protein [Streptomyces sp. SAI-129]|uniref:hypothetical protein n=1 Tax=Streptomyces sp. SAI-129 TaxID=3377727 RepID=UPI003C7D6133